MAVAAEHLQTSPPDMRHEFEALLALWRDFDAPDGHRVEISNGAIRMNALPAGGHTNITAIVHETLLGHVPDGMRVYPLAGVLITELGKLYVPDLVVGPPDALAEEDSTFRPTDVLLVVEVTSPSNAEVDRQEKLNAYAQGGVSQFLLVDRVARIRTVTLYSDPADGEYQHVVRVPFGESIRLPAPFDVDLDTSQFRR